MPTQARPGSPGKIAIMALRLLAGQHIHHPDDAKPDRDEISNVQERTSNHDAPRGPAIPIQGVDDDMDDGNVM